MKIRFVFLIMSLSLALINCGFQGTLHSFLANGEVCEAQEAGFFTFTGKPELSVRIRHDNFNCQSLLYHVSFNDPRNVNKDVTYDIPLENIKPTANKYTVEVRDVSDKDVYYYINVDIDPKFKEELEIGLIGVLDAHKKSLEERENEKKMLSKPEVFVDPDIDIKSTNVNDDSYGTSNTSAVKKIHDKREEDYEYMSSTHYNEEYGNDNYGEKYGQKYGQKHVQKYGQKPGEKYGDTDDESETTSPKLSQVDRTFTKLKKSKRRRHL
jgi:hypothetical protein